MSQPYRILSLDGGGIRGILTARLLVRLHHRVPEFLPSIDLFAGTSTGALIALSLAMGSSPEDVENLYRDHGARIFSARGPLDDLNPLDEIERANYDNDDLLSVLSTHFGTTTLGDLDGSVLVPTFMLDRRADGRSGWAPKIFHNVPAQDGRGDDPDDDPVVDVAMMTSAAPTYFPSYAGAIDGGVYANNPSVCAVSKAVNVGVPLGQIRTLALGTGVLPRFVEGERVDWGLRKWGLKMLSLVMSGMAGVGDYQCQQLLGENYRRVDPILPYDIDLDGWRKMDQLVELAEMVPVEPLEIWVRERFLAND